MLKIRNNLEWCTDNLVDLNTWGKISIDLQKSGVDTSRTHFEKKNNAPFERPRW